MESSLIILLLLYFIFFLFALLRETTFSMVFSLIIVFFIACFLVFNFKCYFLGFMILIIYLGAIAVLFLFMVMLFDRAEYKLFSVNNKNQKNYKVFFLLFCLALSFSFSILYILDYIDILRFKDEIFFTKLWDLKLFISASANLDLINSFASISLVPHNISEAHTQTGFSKEFFMYFFFTDAQLIGFCLYSKYFFLLFMCGLGLLIAMIGCILITKSSFLDKFDRRSQCIEKQLSRFKIY